MTEKRDITINNKFGSHVVKVEIRTKRRPVHNPSQAISTAETQALSLKKKQEALKRASEAAQISDSGQHRDDIETQKKRASFFGDRQLMNSFAARHKKPQQYTRRPNPYSSPYSSPDSAKTGSTIRVQRPLPGIFMKQPAPAVQTQITRKQTKKLPTKFIPSKPAKKTNFVQNMQIGRSLIGRIESEDDLSVNRERLRSFAAFRRSQQKQKKQVSVDTVTREITVFDNMPLIALAHAMAISSDVLIKKLKDFGVPHIKTDSLDLDVCCLLVEEFGHKYRKRVEILDKIKQDLGANEDYIKRAPIVTVVGHVDHGKTSLLDALRATQFVNKESGGITQSIGASQVYTKDGRFITFIDTPGHAIFTEMRARGVDLTDIVLLIIAADNGIQDQTIESIQHIQASKAFIIVVFTKIDKPGANLDKIKQMLMRYNIAVQSMSGDVPDISVSAKSGHNLPELIDLILENAEMLELKANPIPKASGVILEGTMDKNCGAIATVIIRNGTLNKGDSFVAGGSYGKVRSIKDWQGKEMKSAGPAIPVQIMGFHDVPNAGDDFIVIDEQSAKEAAAKRKDLRNISLFAVNKAEMTYSINDIWNVLIGETGLIKLNFIVKADSYGSCEAIAAAINKINLPNVKVNIVLKGIGGITDSDLLLGKASEAMIIAFKVDIKPTIVKNASTWGIKVKRYDIIYQILDDINAQIDTTLAPKEEEVMLGYAEIREIFEKPKIGKIAGCFIQDGLIKRDLKAVLMRNGVQVYSSTIHSIRQLRVDKHEVKAGQECGLIMSKFSDYKIGDIIQCFETRSLI